MAQLSIIQGKMVFHRIVSLQDKREVEASLTLGLTMRGIQIFQVCKWGGGRGISNGVEQVLLQRMPV